MNSQLEENKTAMTTSVQGCIQKKLDATNSQYETSVEQIVDARMQNVIERTQNQTESRVQLLHDAISSQLAQSKTAPVVSVQCGIQRQLDAAKKQHKAPVEQIVNERMEDVVQRSQKQTEGQIQQLQHAMNSQHEHSIVRQRSSPVSRATSNCNWIRP